MMKRMMPTISNNFLKECIPIILYSLVAAEGKRRAAAAASERLPALIYARIREVY
jgi:hypothetical protein